MKHAFLSLALMLTVVGAAQNYKFITFPEDDIRTQFGMFIDAFGKAPSGKPGRQVGLTGTAIMNWGFIEINASQFKALKDGYTDFVVALGVNVHLFEFKPIRYFVGGRLGRNWRVQGGGYEMAGIQIGFDWRLSKEDARFQIYVGAIAWVDHREDQRDGRYGDSTGYDGGIIFKASTAKENGAFRLLFTFN